jgi:hypothetical protein
MFEMLKFKEITRENEIQKLVETIADSSWSLQKLLGLGLRFLKKNEQTFDFGSKEYLKKLKHVGSRPMSNFLDQQF